MGKKEILQVILFLTVAIHLVYYRAVPNRSRRQIDSDSRPVLNCTSTDDSLHVQAIGQFNNIFPGFQSQINRNQIVRYTIVTCIHMYLFLIITDAISRR